MQYIAIQKYLGSSPRKLRLVADLVRKMEPEKALETLSFTNKAAAPLLAKALKTALANAKNASVVKIQAIEINEGPKLRRLHVGTAGRGRGRPFKRRLSHIKVVLTDEMATLSGFEKSGPKGKATVAQKTVEAVENETEVAVSPKIDTKTKKGTKAGK